MLRLTPADLLGHLRCLYAHVRHREGRTGVDDTDRSALARLLNTFFNDDKDDVFWDILDGAPKHLADEAADLLEEIQAYTDDSQPSAVELHEQQQMRTAFHAIKVHHGERRTDRRDALKTLLRGWDAAKPNQGEIQWGA